jgi:hypothetical protein
MPASGTTGVLSTHMVQALILTVFTLSVWSGPAVPPDRISGGHHKRTSGRSVQFRGSAVTARVPAH